MQNETHAVRPGIRRGRSEIGWGGMKKTIQASRQPNQQEIQALLNLYNAGQLQSAEFTARQLLRNYPDTLILHNVLASSCAAQRKFDDAAVSFQKVAALSPNAETLSNLGLVLQEQGKTAEAAANFRKALALQPGSGELHFNLGIALASQGKLDEAIASYRKAAALKPKLAVVHYNLAIVLQQREQADEAIACYRKALALEPGFFEAYGNMGTILQQQGKLDEAVASYRKALAIHADARGHFNLATALRDQGKLDEAIASYRNALALQPGYAEAHNNLGEALRDQGNMQEAVASYQRALAINPTHAEANYNMAQFLYDAGRLDEAIAYFEKSQLDDWQERILYCLYKTEKYEAFNSRMQGLAASKHTSPFLATLSTHYATNFGTEDNYRFCTNPMDFVYHNSIAALASPDSALLHELLRDIAHAEIAERKQGRLHNGIQSAGNLFKRSEASFRQLAALIQHEIEAYRQRFAGADCELMKSFPTETEFSSSWYVKMRQGGHLTSHIHETGWLSGSVYLSLPSDRGSGNDGSIEFSTHGDNYPQKHDNFPHKPIAPKIGDIVLFPSSLFHRTIPFSSNEERICVAFDLKPARMLRGMKLMLVGWANLLVIELLEVIGVALPLVALA
jgi:uncharacterized protein (TIGR02466 family)